LETDFPGSEAQNYPVHGAILHEKVDTDY